MRVSRTCGLVVYPSSYLRGLFDGGFSPASGLRLIKKFPWERARVARSTSTTFAVDPTRAHLREPRGGGGRRGCG